MTVSKVLKLRPRKRVVYGHGSVVIRVDTFDRAMADAITRLYDVPGMLRVGRARRISRGPQQDVRKLANDWSVIGGDLQTALRDHPARPEARATKRVDA